MFNKYLSIIALLIASTIGYADVNLGALQKKASDGDISAQLTLGELYKKGNDVPQDYTLSALWYRKAAEAGNAEAQYYLAEMYSKGEGVPEDWDMSEKWYKESAEKGNAKAQYAYAFFYYNHDHQSILNWFGDYYKNYNYKKAAAWFEKAAEQDHPDALYFLASMYEDGDGVGYDTGKATEYYIKSANLGNSSSQWVIGMKHFDGEDGMEWDYDKAISWFKKAALNGSYFSAEKLGDIYSDGLEKPIRGKNGVSPNPEEAVKWYLLAEKNGSVLVYRKLGRAYLEGRGVSRNLKEAAKWFHESSAKDLAPFYSQNLLANFYKDGQGVGQNFYKCFLWSSLAIHSLKNFSPNNKKMLKEIIHTKKSCEIKLDPTEVKAGKELADKYWDKKWNSKEGLIIPIDL